MMTRIYRVAGHTFAISGRVELFEQMDNLEPFACEGGEPLFSLMEDCGEVPEYTEVYRREEPYITTIVCGHTALGNDVFKFGNSWFLICSKDYSEGRVIMPKCTYRMASYYRLVSNDALKMMYALATAGKDTLCIHAAVVSCEGKGYLFLGSRGTGKSTHARLWLEHVEGTKLVNDDFPVVRGGVVYGSPWLCKTPCYRNVSVPIGGIVMLSQASYNKMRRLSGIEAYVNLYESVYNRPWYRCITEDIAKDQRQTMNKLVSTVPMWHLECLPDEAAARLCHDTITR
jgi:hypothetical protein